jgi:hydroxypyruvate reductase
MALEAAGVQASKLGYTVRVIEDTQTGNTLEFGAAICREIEKRRQPGTTGRVCLLWGGETTMALPPSHGKGGRNQHLALLLSRYLDGFPGATFASVGTDGTDGPTDASGGIVDGGTAGRLRAAGIDLNHELRSCNSHHALAAAGDLLITGPTLTNVMDIQILLLAPPGS